MFEPIRKDADKAGTLFVVATPIGNLGDLSLRAQKVLSDVDLVLAEDTRHSKRLFNHYGISTKLRSCHEHNEMELVDSVFKLLESGQDIALISDAGTPLISDPGFVLVRALRERNCLINAVPGPSSIIAALSVAGLPTDRFIYEGFLPSKTGARKLQFETYDDETRTIVLLESSHRIVASLEDIVLVLGAQRRVVIARELTKKFETVLDGSAAEVLATLKQDPDQTKGEFVLMLEGKAVSADVTLSELKRIMQTLLQELPLKQASHLAAKLTGGRKNDAYDLGLQMKKEQGNK